MAQKITETAQLQCDKGSSPSELAVTSQTFMKANSKLVATEQDKSSGVNIKSFGGCSLTKSVCSPAPTHWSITTAKDSINGYKILTESSVCTCSVGGTIKPTTTGHSGNFETN